MQHVANLANFLDLSARHFPERPALICGEHVWSWREIKARVDAFADALSHDFGVSPGDRILVHAPNGNQLFETMWACWKLGAVWVPSNFRSMPKDLLWMAECSGSTVLICHADAPGHASIQSPSIQHRLSIGGTGSNDYDHIIEQSMGNTAPLANVVYDDPTWLFFTSGTSGKPKASVLTHGQMSFVVNNHLADLMPGLTERDVSLVVAPLSHGAGLHALCQVAKGATTVIPEGTKFDTEQVWALVEKHRVSNMFTVPTILKMMVEDPMVDKCDHSSLRHVIYAGAPMYHTDQVRALVSLGPVLVQYYGLGEVTGCITYLRPDQHGNADRQGTCGLTGTGMQIEIQDDDGNAVPSGTAGEVCVKGAGVFAGYLDNPEANAESFRNGWFRTGDLGSLDADGFLYLTGRASEMYISGGSNISPREVEEEILCHPSICEACVFGIPDLKWGEIGVAVLVTDDGTTPTQQEVKAFLSDRIVGYKIPRQVAVWDSMPKSGNGKITKRVIRDIYLKNGGV